MLYTWSLVSVDGIGVSESGSVVHSGTPLMQTPLGPTQSDLIREVSVFQGSFYVHEIRMGPHTLSALDWMSIFQGCLQGRVPLYRRL